MADQEVEERLQQIMKEEAEGRQKLAVVKTMEQWFLVDAKTNKFLAMCTKESAAQMFVDAVNQSVEPSASHSVPRSARQAAVEELRDVADTYKKLDDERATQLRFIAYWLDKGMEGAVSEKSSLSDFLAGRLKAIDGNIAIEKLSGNVVKEAHEQGARAEIVVLQCEIGRGRIA